MSCPICGVDDRRDDATGYHGADLCPKCQADGFTEAIIDGKVEIINERDKEYEINGNDVRR